MGVHVVLLKICIDDTGPGMSTSDAFEYGQGSPEEQLAHLMDSGYKIANATAAGDFIVYMLVSNRNGYH